jgi:hypothetical protein
MRRPHSHGLLIATLLMGACNNARQPAPPRVIEKPVKVYVEIDATLTARCDWRKDALPSESIEIAKERRSCLERYERQFDAIENVEGQAAP